MTKSCVSIGGLYGIADAAAAGGDPVAIGAAMLLGGCRWIQLRCKGWSRNDVRTAAADLVRRCHAVGACLIVNDDASVAAEVGADGVHLGQLDGRVADARAQLPPGAIVGRSTGQLAEIEAALDADYVAFGPIWDTPHLSRLKPVRGVDRLREVRAALPAHVPLVAIGGITVERLPEVRAAGANAWAVIGAICHAADPVAASLALR